MHLLLALADTLQHLSSKVVVLHVTNTLFNDFAQVIRLKTSCSEFAGF